MKMKVVKLHANWEPKDNFKLGNKDIDGKQSYLGSMVWRKPHISISKEDIPVPGPGEVLIEVKAVGVCGSDVHMAQEDDDGYIWYPGLSGFPCTLGHEFSGIVREAHPQALDKNTNKPFRGGEWVCAEEMLWCGSCRPCCDGYPNHCERLNEIGFNVDGAFSKYIVVPDRCIWSLDPLKEKYSENEVFRLGSLVEPVSVAYNAVIERGGGICPGDNVLICGGGPIGLAAAAVLKKQGASKVILSEPEQSRAQIGREMGVDFVINPLKEKLADRVLEITKGMGANLFLEATGLPDVVYPQIEKIIWEGRTLNSTVVVVARANAKMPVSGEVLQVRRARIVGSQGHSGHGTFPRVIESMRSGLNVLPLITKEITLDELPNCIVKLRTDRNECKVTCIMD